MSGLNRLVYLANARLPTEKAHGYQICKMCEAFALAGLQVTLVHPYRHNPGLQGKSVFDYYSIKPVFQVHTLRNCDVVRLNQWTPDRWFAPLFFVHALLWSLYAAWKVAKERADFYYTREATIAYWLGRLGLPTIFEAHVVPKGGGLWILKRLAQMESLKLVVTLTSFIRQRFLAMGFRPERTIVLPDGVDLSLFENLPTEEECRRMLHLPLDRPIIGYIGRFQTMGMEKGISELVRAIAAVSSVNGKEPLLLCVGGPMDLVPRYLDIAKRFRIPEYRLQFVDRVPNGEVPLWLRACDVLAAHFPWTEHFAYYMSPLKLFEYMASGTPIVASDLPAIKEVLRHNENAILVAPGDPEALASGIMQVLQEPNLAQRIAEQASEDVKRYTWERRARAVLEVLQEGKPADGVG